jgi:hypothetical protein
LASRDARLTGDENLEMGNRCAFRSSGNDPRPTAAARANGERQFSLSCVTTGER